MEQNGIEKEQKIDVRAVAKLAKLEFSEEEMEALERDMNAIVSFADKLGEVDTKGVEASAHINSLKNVLRDDIPERKYDPNELLSAAKTKEDGYITVPRVVEG